MKDESRELIEQYKDMYQKLNEQSIFSLRTYGREIGVAQPTLKIKEELIIHIIKIMNGLEAPAKQSNKGAHPKSQNNAESARTMALVLLLFWQTQLNIMPIGIRKKTNIGKMERIGLMPPRSVFP